MAGWVNLDSANLSGVDVVHDIEKLPLPFGDNEFDEILCQDILEHMTDFIPTLKDLYRILKPGGKLIVRVPHFTSKVNYTDPTHVKRFSIYTFEMFVKDSPFAKSKERQYYFDFHFAAIGWKRIKFDRSSRWLAYNRFMEPLVNWNNTSIFLYESTGWCYEFPAMNIEVELIK